MVTGSSNLIDIKGYLNHTTTEAICVDVDDEEDVWLPKALIEWVENPDGSITITLQESLAYEKGLI